MNEKLSSALIGYSGFVGSTLQKQKTFEELYRSSNIDMIDHKSFDIVVCSAARAQKWIANREPVADRKHIDELIVRLKTIKCKTFILISTVDIFKDPKSIDESSPVNEVGLQPYGLHRRMLEKFVEAQYTNYLIVRLPGLVGPGLRKNVIFDLLNDNNLHMIDSRGVFQFYPMVNLWYDIQTALNSGLRLVHLTAEPVSVSELSKQCFGKKFEQDLVSPPARYDFQTRYASIFGSSGLYQYSKRETFGAIRAYAQSEPLTDLVEKKQ